MKEQRKSHNRIAHRSSVVKRGPEPVLWVNGVSEPERSCTSRSPRRMMHRHGPRLPQRDSQPPIGLTMKKFSGGASARLDSSEFTECSRANLGKTSENFYDGACLTGTRRTPSSCQRVLASENPSHFSQTRDVSERNKTLAFHQICQNGILSGEMVVEAVTPMHASVWVQECDGHDGCRQE